MQYRNEALVNIRFLRKKEGVFWRVSAGTIIFAINTAELRLWRILNYLLSVLNMPEMSA